MAEVSKLNIHERSNVERPNLLVLVTKIGNKPARRKIKKLPILGTQFWFFQIGKF